MSRGSPRVAQTPSSSVVVGVVVVVGPEYPDGGGSGAAGFY